jgi:hypothetical protein
MAIKFSVESPVTCETCKKPAIRRTVAVTYGGQGGREVSYDTHNVCLAEAQHNAAIKRLDRFHASLYALLTECREIPAEDRKLTSGQIIEFDFDTVHPDACSRRTHIIPVATIQAYGLRQELRLGARPMGRQRADKLLAEFKEAAAPLLIVLKKRFEEGHF